MLTTFAQWVTITRGARSQASCAARAGMTPQQWNQIERLVKQPEVETVKRVALGLEVPEEVSLAAAGYDTTAGEPAIRLAREIDQYLMRLRPERRRDAERLLIAHAQQLSEVLSAH